VAASLSMATVEPNEIGSAIIRFFGVRAFYLSSLAALYTLN
jgi:hypothetical protein